MSSEPNNQQPTTDLAPRGDYAEKIVVIRRSMRCLMYSLIGAIPALGVANAIQAARLHYQLARETGETWRPLRLLWFWLGESLIMISLACGGGKKSFFLAYALMITTIIWMLVVLYLGWRMWRLYHRTQPKLWNPGRLWLFWGGWLAWFNITLVAQFLTLLIVELIAFYRLR
jgi:hypothetical protein